MPNCRAAATLLCGCAVLFGQPPVQPLSFEVASLKPASAPIATKDVYTEGYNAGMRAAMAGQGLRVVGQRVAITDNTLKDMIRMAYGLKDYQILGPSWIGSDLFEVAAVMPAGSTRSQAPEMLRRLLEERFHLAIHRETKPMAVFALVEAKGGAKLTPSTSGRGFWAGNTPGHVGARSASIQAFAESLSRAAGRPVVDGTGRTGIYDIDLNFSPDISDETRPGLATALQEQLGLRLEKREMRVDVLVIDQADRVPAGN